MEMRPSLIIHGWFIWLANEQGCGCGDGEVVSQRLLKEAGFISANAVPRRHNYIPSKAFSAIQPLLAASQQISSELV